VPFSFEKEWDSERRITGENKERNRERKTRRIKWLN
jgi:hypothetical protein